MEKNNQIPEELLPETTDPPKIDYLKVGLLVGAGILLILAVHASIILIKNKKPAKDMVGDYEVGVLYKMEYTQKYKNPSNRFGREFKLRDTSIMGIPLEASRGEGFLIPDDSLPENQFKLVRMISPPVSEGAALFQPSYSYVIVRYHAANMGRQDFVPVLEPTNRRVK